MRKKFLKIASAALTAVLGLSLAACGGGGDDSKKPESVDSSKKQLYVYTYDGGYGHEWLNRVKTEYEKIHGDVQIVIDPKKPTSNNINKNFIKNGKNQVFFAEGQTYYSLLAENAIGDLTEAITSVNPYDNKKIIDKFTEELGRKATIVATGDAAPAVIPYCKNKILIDETLHLKGLYYIYKRNTD